MSGPSGSARAKATLATLQKRISSGEWPVGAKIPTEPELVEQLGVGRSTVREAVRSLATLGMVETLTARGTFVRSLTPAPSLLLNALSVYTPAELIGLRRALDVEAVQAAAAQRSDADLRHLDAVLDASVEAARRSEQTHGSDCARFHGAIAKASGNRLLADLDMSLSAVMAASGLEGRIAEAIEPSSLVTDHDRLLTAVRQRDPGIAAHLMAMHLDQALRSLAHEPIVTDLTTLVRADRGAA